MEGTTDAVGCGLHKELQISRESTRAEREHGDQGTQRVTYLDNQGVGKVTTVVWDDFSGSSLGLAGPDAKWFFFSSGDFVGDDGVAVLGNGQLQIRASGTNEKTGAPAFRKTVPQDRRSGPTDSDLPGALDHVKWLAYANHRASTGFPGFDVPRNTPLRFSVDCSAQTFSTANHPFGDRVSNCEADPRLACGAFALIDFETMMVFDFVLTSSAIYALYERLPFAREKLGHYAAFSYAVPLAGRSAHEWTNLAIEYDGLAHRITWRVNQSEAYSVDKIGCHVDRQYMAIDGGGVDETVELRQLNVGFGLFTLLDAGLSHGPALVKLSGPSYDYFDTRKGAPFSQTFLDPHSVSESRLFGQGASLSIKDFTITQ